MKPAGTVVYGYDNTGRTSTVTYPMAAPFGSGSYPAGATTFTYAFDSMGRPTGLTDSNSWAWAKNAQYDYAGRPIGIGAALVMRAVGPQLIGAISIVAAGWYLQMTVLTGYSSLIRILLSGVFCACLYLAVVVGLFRLAEPVRVAGSIAQDLLRRR